MIKKGNEGSVLALAVIVSLIMTLSGLALLNTIQHTGTGVRGDEVQRTKAFYASLSALRFTYLWIAWNSREIREHLDEGNESYIIDSSTTDSRWNALANQLKWQEEGLNDWTIKISRGPSDDEFEVDVSFDY